jgi:hypothetical protein
LPPGRPAIEVTTVVLATANHINLSFNGLYSSSGLPDLIGTLLFALTNRTLAGN